MIAWHLASGAVNHPDYLAYFNELVGTEPERVVVDSDLDWGQDLKRLRDRLHLLGVKRVAFSPAIPVSLTAMGFPEVIPLNERLPYAGWNAIGVTTLKLYRRVTGSEPMPPGTFWVDGRKPTERVGWSILLYYIPPPRATQRSP